MRRAVAAPDTEDEQITPGSPSQAMTPQGRRLKGTAGLPWVFACCLLVAISILSWPSEIGSMQETLHLGSGWLSTNGTKVLGHAAAGKGRVLMPSQGRSSSSGEGEDEGPADETDPGESYISTAAGTFAAMEVKAAATGTHPGHQSAANTLVACALLLTPGAPCEHMQTPQTARRKKLMQVQAGRKVEVQQQRMRTHSPSRGTCHPTSAQAPAPS